MALGQAAPQRPEYNIGELDQLPDQAEADTNPVAVSISSANIPLENLYDVLYYPAFSHDEDYSFKTVLE